MAYYGGYDNGDMAIAPKAGDGKIYKLVRLVSMLAFIIAAVFVILEIATIFPMGTVGNGVVFSIGVLGAGGMITLPWVRVFEAFKDKRYKITAIVFMAIAGVCVVLWIICVWLIIGLVDKAIGEDIAPSILSDLIDSLNIIRASIIVSLQFVVASYVAKNVIKYNKTLLLYQIMSGVSQLFIDFFACLVLTAITITTKGVEFSSTAILLTNKWTWALLAIAVVLSIFPSVVFRRTDKRNLLKHAASDMKDIVDEADSAKAPVANAAEQSVDDKLAKIKELLDKGLITQEEYDKKREDIINSI